MRLARAASVAKPHRTRTQTKHPPIVDSSKYFYVIHIVPMSRHTKRWLKSPHVHIAYASKSCARFTRPCPRSRAGEQRKHVVAARAFDEAISAARTVMCVTEAMR